MNSTVSELRMMAFIFPMDPRNKELILRAADEIDRLRAALSMTREGVSPDEAMRAQNLK